LNLDVYVIRKDGAFLYDAPANNLIAITDKNLYPYFAKQDFIDKTSFVLVYVAKEEDKNTGYDMAFLHAGSSYQNVAVYCAENGIKNVVRGYFDNSKDLKKELKLDKKAKILISQAVGY
jgi:hypothetical protein